jgi:hypothetical protein
MAPDGRLRQCGQTFEGELLGLDRDTGAIVWRYQAPGGINGWPAVAGDLLVVPVGLAQPPRLLALRLGRPATTTTTVPVTTTTIPPVVSLSRDVQPIFDRHCIGCHQASRPPDLRAGVSYRSLVNAGSSECAARDLVAPGSPETSYLVDKLRRAGDGCFVGSGMPPGAPPEHRRAESDRHPDPPGRPRRLIIGSRSGSSGCSATR